ncbi:hypothetical protein GC194_15715 [bacterium]|nr:hypothetical protein [bacterium]
MKKINCLIIAIVSLSSAVLNSNTSFAQNLKVKNTSKTWFTDHKFQTYAYADFIQTRLNFGVMYKNRVYLEAAASAGMGVIWQSILVDYRFIYSPNIKIALGAYLYRGKHPFSGLQVFSFYGQYRGYNSVDGWYNTHYYDMGNIGLRYRHFFGKSNFYYGLKLELVAYSFRNSSYYSIKTVGWPAIGYLKTVSWFNKK